MSSLKIKLYFSPLGILLHYATKLCSLLGQKCIVYGYFQDGKYLKKTRIASTAIITDRKKLVLSDNVWINHYSRIDASGGVTIGKGCQIGFGCCILSHSSHIAIRLMGEKYMEYPLEQRIGYIHGLTMIGDYTFNGGGSYILPGVKIGKGCIIGVNSVVTKDIPDYSVVAGSPAKIIGDTRKQDAPFMDNELVQKTYYNKTVR